MSQIRIDKFLCEAGFGTRSQVKLLIKNSSVKINKSVIKKADIKLDYDIDKVYVNNQLVSYSEYEYYMLNKPMGYVSATTDNLSPTVVSLIKSNKKDLFPVGRLDKDTEGLLLITNDGELSHNLLSPRKHVNKTYYAVIDNIITTEDVNAFEKGIDIGEDKLTKPAKLVIKEVFIPTNEQLLLYNSDCNNMSYIEVTICEGKFHQIKRMFEAIGKHVIYLKRLSMGTLSLDDQLPLGEYRPLTCDELNELKNH